MAYPREMTEEEILDEVNWLLHPDDALKHGPRSKVCHHDFWALFIKKLVKERKELQENVELLERRLDCFEV